MHQLLPFPQGFNDLAHAVPRASWCDPDHGNFAIRSHLTDSPNGYMKHSCQCGGIDKDELLRVMFYLRFHEILLHEVPTKGAI